MEVMATLLCHFELYYWTLGFLNLLDERERRRMREKGGERNPRISNFQYQKSNGHFAGEANRHGFQPEKQGRTETQQEEGWTLVTNRKRRNWIQEENIRMGRIHDKFLNMYYSNFPEDWTEAALKDILEKFVGKILDVTISGKRAKDGKRFAFVRFVRVRDEEALIRRAKFVWIGLYKLLANVTRFNKLEYKQGEKKEMQQDRSGLMGKAAIRGMAKSQTQTMWRRKGVIKQINEDGKERNMADKKERNIAQQVGQIGKAEETKADKTEERKQEEQKKDEKKGMAARLIIIEPKLNMEEENLRRLLEAKGYAEFRLAKLTDESWIVEHKDEKDMERMLEERKETSGVGW